MIRSINGSAGSLSSGSGSAHSSTLSRSPTSQSSAGDGLSSLPRRPVPSADNSAPPQDRLPLRQGRSLRDNEAGTSPVPVGSEARSSTDASPASDREDAKTARKVGRIVSQMVAKCDGIPGAADVVKALSDFVQDGMSPRAAIRGHFVRQSQPSLRELQFNRFLLAALHIAVPGEDVKDLADLVQRQWSAISGQQPMKVIAHRGDGNTSMVLSCMPSRESFDRLYPHENENSVESTKKFLSAWSNPSSRLSGIECDVYLSADDVPFVTHSHKIWAQLEQETCRDREPVVGDGDDIRNHPAHEVPDRYLTLARWLDLVGSGLEERIQAEDAARQRGEAVPQETTLRVEIEGLPDNLWVNSAVRWFCQDGMP